MLVPVFSWLKLAIGIFELIVVSLTFRKVYNGSKSDFSYTLLVYVLLNGLNCLSYFIVFNATHEVLGTTKPNFYAFYITRYWFFLMSLQ
jgi:hypothetical protein